MNLIKEQEPFDSVMRLLEAVTALSGVPMFRAARNYLADDMNNVFLRLSEEEYFKKNEIKISVDCRPECEDFEPSKKKIKHLEVLMKEIFEENHLPFKNRYPPRSPGPNPYHAGPPTISSDQ